MMASRPGRQNHEEYWLQPSVWNDIQEAYEKILFA